MNVREKAEKWEKEYLSHFATQSIRTKGRRRKEEPCSVRTEFQKDTDRILHSLSFRLLKHKTQVFLSTTGEKFRTRLTHTLEVASIARYIARALKLNHDLVEAIALGHDLGHTPFGHMGEQVLNNITPFEFRHALQSVRVVGKIENCGKGLNLTKEVIEGIRVHSKGDMSMYKIHSSNRKRAGIVSTLEAEVVQFADWIAYINHDVDDAFNMGLINEGGLPQSTYRILGADFQERWLNMVKNIVEESTDRDHINMSGEIMEATDELRQFLYDHVYSLPKITNRNKMVIEAITFLYDHLMKNYDLVLEEMPFLEDVDPARGACDFISSLTDVRVQKLYRQYSK